MTTFAIIGWVAACLGVTFWRSERMFRKGYLTALDHVYDMTRPKTYGETYEVEHALRKLWGDCRHEGWKFVSAYTDKPQIEDENLMAEMIDLLLEMLGPGGDLMDDQRQRIESVLYRAGVVSPLVRREEEPHE